MVCMYVALRCVLTSNALANQKPPMIRDEYILSIKMRWKKTVGFTSLCSEGWKTVAWKTKLLIKSWINYTQRVSNIRTLPLRYNHSNCHSCDCLQSCRFLQGTIHVLFTLCLGTCWLQCEHCGFVVSRVTHLQLQTSALSFTSQLECSFIKRHFSR